MELKRPIRSMLVLIVVYGVVFFIGFASGQDHPKPGTVMTSQQNSELIEYEALVSPPPKSSVVASVPGSYIKVIRVNNPTVIPDGESYLVLASLEHQDPWYKGAVDEYDGVFDASMKFHPVTYDRWTRVGSTSFKWVYDQSLGSKFEAFEIRPNK